MATGNILAVVASGPWGYFRADPIRFSLGFLVLASPFASILLTYRRCARPFPFFSGPFFLALFPIFFTEVHLLMDLHRFIEIEDLTDLAYVTARLHGFIGEGLGGFIVSGIAILFYSALYFAARRSVITTNPPSGSASEDVADGS